MPLPHAFYRPDIDGLRAIAVLAVLFFHADLGFSGGFVGVDVFFVISGYLLTGIITREMEAGTFRFSRFWERRIRRIWPAMIVMLTVVIATAWFCMLPTDFADLGQSALMHGGMIANLYFWRDSGYFAGASTEKPLLHTWSLAVEEQFYILLPILLLGLYKSLSASATDQLLKTKVFKALCLLGVGSFVLGASWVFWDANTAFYWLPQRAWELLAGGVLACLPKKWEPSSLKWRNWASWTGLAIILWVACQYDDNILFPGLSALPPCLGSCAIIWANLPAQGQPLVGAGKVLSWRPLVWIGLISYSLYLWHWPVLVLARYLAPEAGFDLDATARAGLLGVSFLLATLSWRWVETPVRTRQWLGSSKSVFTFGFTSSALCILVGWGLFDTGGVPNRLPHEAQTFAAAKLDKPKDWTSTWVTLDDALKGRFKTLGEQSSAPPSIMLWGDSHARCLMPALDEWSRKTGLRGEAAVHMSLCPTLGFYRKLKHGLKADALPFGEAVLERVRTQKIRHTILTAYWSKCGGDKPERFQTALKNTIQSLQAAGSQVWIVLDVPAQKFDVPKALALHRWNLVPTDPRLRAVSVETHRKANHAMYDILPELEKLGARILDPADLLSRPDGLTLIDWQGAALYFDGSHFSRSGAMKLMPIFEPIFQSHAVPRPLVSPAISGKPRR